MGWKGDKSLKNRVENEEIRVTLLPEYGRKKLLNYADTFRELAQVYEEKEEQIQDSEPDRQEVYVRKCKQENRQMLSEQLAEMAQIMSDVAGETYRLLPVSDKRKRMLQRAFHMEGIDLDQVHRTLCGSGGHETEKLCLSLRRQRGDAVSSEDVAGMLSVLLNARYLSADDNPFFLPKDYTDFVFLEESRYHCMTGAVLAPKDTEKQSGDNYFIEENTEGILHMVLSDGMGSGEDACKDSSMVVEMMEQLLESGFTPESAIGLVNHAFYNGAGGQNIATLDYCELNLHSGTCRFYKVGAAASYIKRGRMVEQISSQNLPLGGMRQTDLEPEERDLMDGDFVILFSDGVSDSFTMGLGEDMLAEVISQMELNNPNEMANYLLNYCLHQSQGRIRDDLTILVAGIWEN